MGLLEELPAPERFAEILADVVGDEARGVTAVLRLLRELDPPTLSAALATSLGDAFQAGVPLDADTVLGEPVQRLDEAEEGLRIDPAGLVGPLGASLATIRGLSTGDLPARLQAGIDGLTSLQALEPASRNALLGTAAAGVERLKDELAGGAFGELRAWSTVVEAFRAELAPMFAAGPGGLEDRLVTWLATKLGELTRLLLVGELDPGGVAGPLRALLSGDRLAAIAAIKAEVERGMARTQGDFTARNFTNTANLATTRASFARLVAELRDLAATLRTALETKVPKADDLWQAQRAALRRIQRTEVVDLGNVRDGFAAAIGRAEQVIREIDLDAFGAEVEGFFNRLDAEVKRFDLGGLAGQVEGLAQRIDELVAGLDAALFGLVAALRERLAGLQQALHGVAATLGSFDEQGRFHFTVERQLADFLAEVRSGLQQTVQPRLQQFLDTVGQTLSGVEAGLRDTHSQIESVKAELRAALEGASRRLQDANLPAAMESVGQRLEEVLDGLGQVDFDVVIDPVIAEIDEMRELLRGIDVAALGEVTVGALKASLTVLVELEFGTRITDVLLQELDRILQAPRNGLAEIERRVEGGLQALAALEPTALLAPLRDLFEPVEALLDQIELERLAVPIDAWYRQAEAQLAALEPAALLRPLIVVHARMEETLAAIAPEALVQPLQELLDAAAAELGELDLGEVVERLGTALDDVRALLAGLSPSPLLAPLVELFDQLLGALDGFDPTTLLQPLDALFEELTAPLERLTADHAQAIAMAFVPLKALPDLLDPRQNQRALADALAEVLALTRQLDIGRLIVDLKGPYDALQAALTAGGPAGAGLVAEVDALNPLREPSIGEAAADLQEARSLLERAVPSEPPADLVQQFESLRPTLEALVPGWARGEVTPDAVRRGFRQASPFGVVDDVGRLWAALKERLASLDPRALQERLQASFDRLTGTLAALDPVALLTPLQATLDRLPGKLAELDLGILVEELRGLMEESQALVGSLDPRPVVVQLEGLAAQVRATVASLNPAQALRELDGPLGTARQIVSEFDPASFAEPLEEVFEDVRSVLDQVDVGVLLEPLTQRLDALRAELERGLRRTETAFNAMVAAAPV
jgi:hypothetical protein